MSDEHDAVDGGFECWCGATRQTPIGIARHRATHHEPLVEVNDGP